MDDQANRQYITNKVHPIYENLLVDLLISKPEDVVKTLPIYKFSSVFSSLI